MSDSRISIRVSNQLKHDLGVLAELLGKSESDVVREAIEEYCARNQRPETAYELFQKSGLLGCIEGPSDLSTNKEYMEGMGRD